MIFHIHIMHSFDHAIIFPMLSLGSGLKYCKTYFIHPLLLYDHDFKASAEGFELGDWMRQGKRENIDVND